jgi:hypothetical protein
MAFRWVPTASAILIKRAMLHSDCKLYRTPKRTPVWLLLVQSGTALQQPADCSLTVRKRFHLFSQSRGKMKLRYRLIRHGLRGGTFYCVDTAAKQRTSLGTSSEEEARQIVQAKNQALRQPVLNLQIAKAYMAGSDPSFVRRMWRDVMAEFVATKTGTNRTRSERALANKAFDSIRELQVLETRSEHFLRVLKSGKLSTNAYLRRKRFWAGIGDVPGRVMTAGLLAISDAAINTVYVFINGHRSGRISTR